MTESLIPKESIADLLEVEAGISLEIITLQHRQIDLGAERNAIRAKIQTLRMVARRDQQSL